ncbi:MAG: NADPH-dependent glutamate synthase [bacterium]
MSIKKRHPMPVQDEQMRRCNFDEVALGYGEADALAEAERCLHCPNPACVTGCPVAVDIPAFIAALRQRDYGGAIAKIKETNSLPAVCGRVCPQEDQCEKNCVLAKAGQPVAIGRLERFAADREDSAVQTPAPPDQDAPRVAVVGSGPAGLTAAGDLVKLGYRVTVFEALHLPGGVLSYGIPEFRLPKSIVRREVDYLRRLGVEIVTDTVVGKTVTVDELLADGYAAVFVGTGAGLPGFLGIPGENLNGVYSANEFLTRINLMQAYRFPAADTPVFVGRKVAVVGGGNVAMDAARCAVRLGAAEAAIVYRRSEAEMPARQEEVEHAKEEGVQFNLLTSPVRIEGGKEGWVTGLTCVRMELGEPDKSGRRRPRPVEGSEFFLACDTVVVAIGQSPNPLVLQTTPGLAAEPWGGITADEATGKTTKEGVYAGGDAVTGAATVIKAMGAGKQAAAAIHRQLSRQKR